MYVKTFASDTLDGALKQIKQELGPEAIILKTVTNKGLKGTFKKSRIEITAAITEKDYEKKAKVDAVMKGEQKEKFYKAPAKAIAQMIDAYDEKNDKKAPSKKQGYGSLGLNKVVKSKVRDELDNFLKEENEARPVMEKRITSPASRKRPPAPRTLPAEEHFAEDSLEELVQGSGLTDSRGSGAYERTRLEPQEDLQEAIEEGPRPNRSVERSKADYPQARWDRVDELEKKVEALTRALDKIEGREPRGLYQLRSILKSVGIDESFVQKIVKKALFEYNDQELGNADFLFDICLREMSASISTSLPLFSSSQINSRPVVTIFISEVSCGQTSIMYKLGALKKDALLIVHGQEKRTVGSTNKGDKDQHDFIKDVLKLEVHRTKDLAEIVNVLRTNVDEGKSVFVDFKALDKGPNEAKGFIDSIKKAFPHVEVLLCLSAIHSESYNKNLVYKYRDIVNGLVFSYLDLCLNFSSIFNVHAFLPDVPLKFFGTGDVIPEDIEAASPERILSKIFGLE